MPIITPESVGTLLFWLTLAGLLWLMNKWMNSQSKKDNKNPKKWKIYFWSAFTISLVYMSWADKFEWLFIFLISSFGFYHGLKGAFEPKGEKKQELFTGMVVPYQSKRKTK